MGRKSEKLQALRKVRGFIQEKRMRQGDRLPSERSLAESLGMSRPLLRQALKDLDGQEIDRRGKTGTFVLGAACVFSGNPKLVSAILLDSSGHNRQRLVHDYLQERGHMLNLYLPCDDHQDPDKERVYLESLLALRPKGLLSTATPRQPNNRSLFRKLSEVGVRVAHVEHYELELPAEPFFLPDFRAAGLAAVGMLAKMGIENVYGADMEPPQPTHFLARQGLDMACLGLGMRHVELPLPSYGHTEGTDESLALYRQVIPKKAGMVVMGGGAPVARSELIRAFGSAGKAIPIIGIAEWDSAPVGFPYLVFDWSRRVKDALDFILSDNPDTLSRILYLPKLVI